MVPRGMLPILGIVLAVRVFFCGVWFLSLSLAGFGFFTLKLMNLTRRARTSLRLPSPP